MARALYSAQPNAGRPVVDDGPQEHRAPSKSRRPAADKSRTPAEEK